MARPTACHRPGSPERQAPGDCMGPVVCKAKARQELVRKWGKYISGSGMCSRIWAALKGWWQHRWLDNKTKGMTIQLHSCHLCLEWVWLKVPIGSSTSQSWSFGRRQNTTATGSIALSILFCYILGGLEFLFLFSFIQQDGFFPINFLTDS